MRYAIKVTLEVDGEDHNEEDVPYLVLDILNECLPGQRTILTWDVDADSITEEGDVEP